MSKLEQPEDFEDFDDLMQLASKATTALISIAWCVVCGSAAASLWWMITGRFTDLLVTGMSCAGSAWALRGVYRMRAHELRLAIDYRHAARLERAAQRISSSHRAP